MIIVLRGANGSGKTHQIRELLKQVKTVMHPYPYYESQVVTLQRVKSPVMVVGPYTEGRSMGGCDCIRPVSLIYDAIDHAWVRNWHVVLEGAVLAAKPFLEYHRQGRDVRFILLDPPLRSSLARIKARQKQKGQVTPFSPEVIAERGRIAHDAYVEAGQIGMTTMQFHTPFIDAVPWILAQLRSV